MNPIERFYGHPQRMTINRVNTRGNRHQGDPANYWTRRRWDGGSASTLFKCQKLERLALLRKQEMQGHV